MKTFFAFGLTLFLAAGAEGQMRMPAAATPRVGMASAGAVRAGVVRPGAPSIAPRPTQPLGAFPSYASSRPLGGIVGTLPAFPSSSAPARRRGHHREFPRYVGPVYYVPNAFDAVYNYSSQDYGAAPEAPPSEPQHVIVNQYFATTPTALSAREEAERPAAGEQPANPGDPIGPVENYYLIAYKNHTIYPALAWWVEGDTLHYVTTHNTHNQASIALLDIERTTKLNADRAIPFSLPGR
ncbi:MAG: hypothetical protein ABJC09_09125 [Terriglobia bacterium]